MYMKIAQTMRALSDIYSGIADSFEEADRLYRQYAEELRRTSETYWPESVNGN